MSDRVNSDEFVAKSLRHLDALRRTNSSPASPKPKYPSDWFDLPEKQLADLGAMYFLMSLAPFHRPRTHADSFAVLEPALRLNQYQIFRSGGFPRAFLTWAGLSAEAEKRFAVDQKPLRAGDWASGKSRWIVDLVAPFGHIEQILKMLSESKHKGSVRTLWHNKTGNKARILEWHRSELNSPISVKSYNRLQFADGISGN